jgi:hypothetical protein
VHDHGLGIYLHCGSSGRFGIYLCIDRCAPGSDMASAKPQIGRACADQAVCTAGTRRRSGINLSGNSVSSAQQGKELPQKLINRCQYTTRSKTMQVSHCL